MNTFTFSDRTGVNSTPNEVLVILHNSLTRHNHSGKLGKLDLFVLFLIIVNLQLSQSKKKKKMFKTHVIPIEYDSILVLKATESIGLHLITLLFLLQFFSFPIQLFESFHIP